MSKPEMELTLVQITSKIFRWQLTDMVFPILDNFVLGGIIVTRDMVWKLGELQSLIFFKTF